MQNDYSIEQHSNKINNPKIKEYFAEVASSYAIGNYRSAIVILWSVVVCDLLFKLQQLAELHADESAKEILKGINGSKENNPQSAQWEYQLLDEISKRTQLIDIQELKSLEYLRTQRNLAAHPVINYESELLCPNQETVRALIRESLEGVLTKPPFFSKKIVTELLKDIKYHSDTILNDLNDNNLKDFLRSKYFDKFTPAVEKKVFKDMWKFVFRLTNDDCTTYRPDNFRVLQFLFERNRSVFIEQIKQDSVYFSTISNDNTSIVYLIRILASSPEIYEFLEDQAKAIVRNTAECDDTAKCFAWFLANDLNSHFAHISEEIDKGFEGLRIDESTFKEFSTVRDTIEWDKGVIKICIVYYGASTNFNLADERFRLFIRPLLSKFVIEDCKKLVKVIKGNNQTYKRGLAQRDHKEIISRITEICPTYDIESLGIPDFDALS